VAPDRTPELAAPGVTFELERFEWAGGDRLELVGRWSGLRGQRFLRPTLDVVVGGERRRMLAVLEHKPWAAEEGEEWIAAFAWRGDQAKFEDAELTVSPELAVPLPSAGGAARGSKKAAASVDRRPARRPRSAVLEAELGTALADAQELREQLRTEQTNVRGLETQLRQSREELASAETDRDAARTEAEEARAAAQRARADAEKARARADAEQAKAEAVRREAEAARTEAETPELEKARAELEKAGRERDAALERLAAAESERAAMAEARDRARDERNAWMQRARAAAAGRPSAARAATSPQSTAAPAPPPEPSAAGDRRTIQIGERPGPLRTEPPRPVDRPGRRVSLDAWGPRLLAALALVALAAVVLVLVFWAL
jgi:hypothetical protein